MNNNSKWKLADIETTSYGDKIRHYESDGYKVTLQKSDGVYHITNASFDLCHLNNYSSKSIGAIFKQINTLFV